MYGDQWRKSLRPRIEKARENLSRMEIDELARRGGLDLWAGKLELTLVGKKYMIRWPELVVCDPKTGEVCPEEFQILVLDYLSRATGAKPSGQWIGFQDLPHGEFYRQAFQSYTGDELVRALRGDLGAFRRGAERLGGIALNLGDASYAFFALPLVPLAVVWWEGEEGLPPSATVLFDAQASFLLPTEGLAILGRMLCHRLIKAAQTTEVD